MLSSYRILRTTVSYCRFPCVVWVLISVLRFCILKFSSTIVCLTDLKVTFGQISQNLFNPVLPNFAHDHNTAIHNRIQNFLLKAFTTKKFAYTFPCYFCSYLSLDVKGGLRDMEQRPSFVSARAVTVTFMSV